MCECVHYCKSVDFFFFFFTSPLKNVFYFLVPVNRKLVLSKRRINYILNQSCNLFKIEDSDKIKTEQPWGKQPGIY